VAASTRAGTWPQRVGKEPAEIGYAAAVWFEPGQVITRRYLRGQWCTWAQSMRVISDDETGLLLWQPDGSDLATLVDADGNTPHEVTPTGCGIQRRSSALGSTMS
jgi:hypothetical protein